MIKKFRLYLLLIILTEVISFVGWLIPEIGTVGFFAVAVVALLFSVEKLEYGLLFLFAELFIGSKGYLFSYEYEGALFSARIALFLVVMSAWLGKIILDWMDISKAPKIDFEPWMTKSKEFMQQDLWSVSKKITGQNNEAPAKVNVKPSVYFYFGLLFLAITWSIVNGILRHNGFNNVFFDFNAWVYFAVIFPFAYILKNYSQEKFENFLKSLFIVFSASITWLSLKTLGLFYLFSHDISYGIDKVYKWVRDTGVGEITPTGGGFSRIFIQSQIYVVFGLLVFAALSFYYLLKQKENRREENKWQLFYCFIILLLNIATIIVSLSRSFWVGLAAALLFYCFFILLFFYKQWRVILLHIIFLITSAVLGFAFVVGIAAFPYPQSGVFNVGVFKDRAGELNGEAAVSSRWNLLPVLVEKIKKAPFLGSGFGAQATYITQDPRILAKNPTGEYTTYAFEWGWLDIWIKLGAVGLLFYIILILKIFVDGIKRLKILDFRLPKLTAIALLSGLVMLLVTSIFSPYLNHPLGIGYLVLVAMIFKK